MAKKETVEATAEVENSLAVPTSNFAGVSPLNWPATVIETRKIADLKPHPRNPKNHSAKQVKEIAKSMRQWGWTMPLLIDEDSTILAGHGRVLGGKKNGYTEAPVIVARGWTEEQKLAYLMADNQLTENGSWNKEMLGVNLAELEMKFDLDLIGFSDDALNKLMGRDDDDEGLSLTSKYEILITCETEQQQSDLLAQFSEQGLVVKALIA